MPRINAYDTTACVEKTDRKSKLLLLSNLKGVKRASSLKRHADGQQETSTGFLNMGELAGRLIELSAPDETASALLTVSMQLVAEAQRKGEPVCWVMTGLDPFFPPDAADTGVNVFILPVIRINERNSKPEIIVSRAVRAARILVRSGAFGLVVVDLGRLINMPRHALSELKGAVLKHHTAVLFLTRKSARCGSLGSLISLHGEALRMPAGIKNTIHDQGDFYCTVEILKDKMRGPGRRRKKTCSSPPGLT